MSGGIQNESPKTFIFFHLQAGRKSSVDEQNFVCGRNKNRLRTKYFSTADEIEFHCGGTTISLRWYNNSTAPVRPYQRDEIFLVQHPLRITPLPCTKKLRTSPLQRPEHNSVYIQQIWSLVFLVATDHLPQAGSDAATHQRSHDEHPNLRQGIATLEKGRTERTGRIDTRARVVNTHQVNEDE